MAVKSIIKYTILLDVLVEKISTTQFEKFALVIDVWSEKGTYFLAKFASFQCKHRSGFKDVLLAFTLRLQEECYPATVHFKTSLFVLQLFANSEETVVANVE